MVSKEVACVDVNVDTDAKDGGGILQGAIRRSEEKEHQPTEEVHRAAREQSPSMMMMENCWLGSWE